MERIIFDKMKKNSSYHFVLNWHLQNYVFAHQHIYNKKIIDAACGTCFGSMIYSTAAKSIIAVDKDKKAIEYGVNKLPFFCPMRFIVADLETTVLPKADVCVTIETIEHLKDTFFLEKLKVEKLIYTVPINMGGNFHKQLFKTPNEAIDYIKSGGWFTTYYMYDDSKGSMLGVARR